MRSQCALVSLRVVHRAVGPSRGSLFEFCCAFEKPRLLTFWSTEPWDAQPDATITCAKGGRHSGKCFATAWSDKTVRVFTLGVSKAVLELSGLQVPATGLAFNHSEEVLAGGDERGGVTLWSLKQGKVARTIEGGGGSKPVTEIAFHPSGAHAVFAGHDMMTRVWDLREQKCVQTYSAHEKTTSISFSPGAGSYIVSGGISGLAKVWDVRAGKILTTLKKHAGAVTDIQFHPTSLVMATAGEDGVVNFWNADTFTKLSGSAAFKEPVRSVSFAQDGSAALAVSDSTLRVMAWEPYALLDSVTGINWGPVRDAFVRKDKLYATSVAKDCHSASLMLLGLTSGIKPFSADPENVAPEMASVAAKPAAPEPVAAAKPEPVPAPAPVAAAPKEEPIAVAAPAAVVAPIEQPAAVVEQPKVEAKAVTVMEKIERPPAAIARSESDHLRRSADKQPQAVFQQPAPPPVQPLNEAKKSGSHRGSSSAASAAAPASNSNSGSQRRHKAKDQTKPASTVVPAQHVGIVPAERTAALGLKADEFRAKSKNARSDEEILDLCMQDHSSMCATLSTRKTHVAAVRALWNKDSVWKAVSQMKEAKELSVVVDVFQNLSTQQLRIVPLEVLNVLLLEMLCLLQSEFEEYCVLGCTMLRNVNKVFGAVLKATRDKAADARSDAVFAERLEVTNVCWDTLCKCALQLKENMGCGGRVASASREVLALFRRAGVQ